MIIVIDRKIDWVKKKKKRTRIIKEKKFETLANNLTHSRHFVAANSLRLREKC